MASWWGRSHGSRHQSFRTLKTRDMAPLALPARITALPVCVALPACTHTPNKLTRKLDPAHRCALPRARRPQMAPVRPRAAPAAI